MQSSERTNNNRVEKGSNEKEKTILVEGEVEEENMEWLERSIIGETIKPINFSLMVDRLLNEWRCITSVREMGAFKALVTFETKEDREEAMKSGMELLLQHFAEVRCWCEEEWCQTRRTWIECYGIPLHAWSKGNLKKVAEVWGSMVWLDRFTEEMKSLSVAKILIDTCMWQQIQGWVVLKISGCCFDIYVNEVGSEVYSRSCFNLNDQIILKQAEKSSISASSEDTWPGETLRQNSTRVPDLGETSKTQVNEEEDEVISMAMEIQTIHECEVNSQGMKECEVGDRLNRMNDLDTSRTQSLQDDRRTFEVMQDRGLQNQGVELGGNKPCNLVSSEGQRMETNGPNMSVSCSLSAPPGFERKSRDNGLCFNGKEHEEVQDNDTTEQEVLEEEARNTWNLGKAIGLHARNEEEVIKALMKSKKGREVNDGQKKRGRQTKKKGKRRKKVVLKDPGESSSSS